MALLITSSSDVTGCVAAASRPCSRRSGSLSLEIVFAVIICVHSWNWTRDRLIFRLQLLSPVLSTHQSEQHASESGLCSLRLFTENDAVPGVHCNSCEKGVAVEYSFSSRRVILNATSCPTPPAAPCDPIFSFSAVHSFMKVLTVRS